MIKKLSLHYKKTNITDLAKCIYGALLIDIGCHKSHFTFKKAMVRANRLILLSIIKSHLLLICVGMKLKRKFNEYSY